METENKIIKKIKKTILQSKRETWNKKRNYGHKYRIAFFS